MEDKLDNNVVTDVSTIEAPDGSIIDVKLLNDDISWFRSSISVLMDKVFRMEDDDRREKDEREYEISRLKQQVEQLNSMYNVILNKLFDVQNYVSEMAKDYVEQYSTVNAE